MRRKVLINQILLHFGFITLLNLNAQALTFYLLSNHDNVGDHNQVLGVFRAFKKLSNQSFSSKDINTNVMSPSKIKDDIKKDLVRGKIIIVGAGEGGIDGIMNLSAHPNLIICLTSHMFLERYKDPDLIKKVKFIALPIRSSPAIKKQLGVITLSSITLSVNTLSVKLIETMGVAHNRQPEEADKVYKKWGNTELPPCKTYLGVILGGDAPVPGPAKEIKLFTEHDAAKLADYVFQNANNACILVLNGPRTGKYDHDKKEIPTVHRKGYSDRITKIFEQKLEAKGLKNIKVFDFQHPTPECNTQENKAWGCPYNSFDLVIGALRATNGMLIVPGDSTSVISEAIDTLPPGKVLVYEDSAMNKIHKAHLISELRAGRIAVLENYHRIKSPKSNARKLESHAAMIIAQELMKENLKNTSTR